MLPKQSVQSVSQLVSVTVESLVSFFVTFLEGWKTL